MSIVPRQGLLYGLFPIERYIIRLELVQSYHFEAGSPRDGVTVTVPMIMHYVKSIPAPRYSGWYGKCKKR